MITLQCNLNKLITIKSWSSLKLLFHMLSIADKDNVVHLTTNVRKEISNKLDMSPNTITNNLKSLKNDGLISGEKGDFVIDSKIIKLKQ